jgi:hypothetical protein
MPKPETVRKAIKAIKRTADYEYFFNQLKSPAWLDPLWSEGFFRSPLPPIRDDKYITFPVWPESRYLARMAKLKPETVVEIALQIPETENVRVHEDVIEAALAMPPDLAARLVGKAKAWAESPRLFLPDKFGKLISHLARGGEEIAALDIARSLLAVFARPVVGTDQVSEFSGMRPKAEARFDNWHYQQILNKNIPDLVATVGEKGLIFLCDLLVSAVAKSRHETEIEEDDDYSYIWRPAIEDHPQNHPHGLRHLLVSAVRDASEQITVMKLAPLPKLIGILEGRRWSIFRRIALHLIRLFPDEASGIIQQRLTDRKYFDDIGVRHEYFLLIQSQFKNLRNNERAKILNWIETGPELKAVTESYRDRTGMEPTETDLNKFAKNWRLKHLVPIKNELPVEWRTLYDKWVAELGEPDHPDLVSYMTSWVGPTSPKNTEEISSMNIEELISFLKKWRSFEENHAAPSPEGLGRELTSVVAREPQRFADAAELFKELNPTYVRAIVSGLRDAVGQNRSFAWLAVLKLCSWVIQQPREIEGRKSEYSDLDPGWLWTRKSIAELLESGLKSGDAEIPFGLRTKAWQVIRPLAEDAEPTPEYEELYGGSNMDPATLSINTTRPQSIHTAVRYALWVHRHTQEGRTKGDSKTAGFNCMPEVRELLDAHLNPLKDRSLAVRSVYGQWFPWLVLLDFSWATCNAEKIFPMDSSSATFFEASWNTYIVFCTPQDTVLEILKLQYAAAVEKLKGKAETQDRPHNPEEHLAEHLMAFYWTGKLSLSDPEGLFARFWINAEDQLRGHALEFIGRSLSGSNGTVPRDVLERLIALWQTRIETARSSLNPDDYYHEIASFGWWFTSGQFDDNWAMENLKAAIDLAHRVQPDHLVVERLASIVDDMPLPAVESLRLIINADTEGWGIYGWRDEAELILGKAIRGTEPAARDAAIEIIHQLGARGYSEFRALLPSSSRS